MSQNLFGNSVYSDMTDSERTVAKFLTFRSLWWHYEQPVFVADDKGRPRVWTPDFYIPGLGIHIEVVGNNYADYSYREEIYRQNRIPIIFIYPNKSGWQVFLSNEILRIHQERWELLKRSNSI